MSRKPQLRFSRFEQKYLIPVSYKDEIIAYFERKSELDHFNLNDKPYIVNSIYFDSPDFVFYQDKINGYPNRKKIRVRYYDKDYDSKVTSQAFLEIKHKFWDKVFKERVLIDRKFMNNLLTSNFVDMTKHIKNNSKNEFIYWSNLLNLEPKVNVIYERLAFLDKIADCKVTFDSNLLASSSVNLSDTSRELVPIIDNYVIMELKFSNIVPDYIIDAIKFFNLNRLAVSKYCLALEAVSESIII